MSPMAQASVDTPIGRPEKHPANASEWSTFRKALHPMFGLRRCWQVRPVPMKKERGLTGPALYSPRTHDEVLEVDAPRELHTVRCRVSDLETLNNLPCILDVLARATSVRL